MIVELVVGYVVGSFACGFIRRLGHHALNHYRNKRNSRNINNLNSKNPDNSNYSDNKNLL